MSYRAVIFDLDGVLCFTDRYHYLAWKRLADSLKLPFDETVNHRLRGVSRMESLSIVLEASDKTYSREEKLLFAEEKNRIYRTLLQNMTPADVSGETRETLNALRRKNIRLAVGSSSKNTPLILEKTELNNFFDAICDGNHITKSKPNPEVFLKAADMLALKPENCLVVEDAEAGIAAGAAGGFDTAAIGELAPILPATYRLTALSDLLDIV